MRWRRLLRKLTAGIARRRRDASRTLRHFLAGDPATVFIYEQYVDEAALDRAPELGPLPGVRGRRGSPG